MPVPQQQGSKGGATEVAQPPAPSPEGKTGAEGTGAGAGGGTAAVSGEVGATGGGDDDLAKRLQELEAKFTAVETERDSLQEQVAGLQKHKRKSQTVEEQLAELRTEMDQKDAAARAALASSQKEARKLKNLDAVLAKVPAAHSKRARLAVLGFSADGLDLAGEDRDATITKALERLKAETPDLLEEPTQSKPDVPGLGRVSNGQAVLPAGAGGVVRDGQRYL